MSQIELAEVLKAKLAKLEQLYRSELDRTNQESEKNFLKFENDGIFCLFLKNSIFLKSILIFFEINLEVSIESNQLIMKTIILASRFFYIKF